jgi:hypothetical protein
MYYILMTVASSALLALSFFTEGLLGSFSLWGAGLFFGHVLTEALNHR